MFQRHAFRFLALFLLTGMVTSMGMAFSQAGETGTEAPNRVSSGSESEMPVSSTTVVAQSEGVPPTRVRRSPGLPGSELPSGAQDFAPEQYRDVPAGHWASDAIRRLSVLGVFTGYPDETFRGTEFATRFELAVVAARIVDLIGGSLANLALDPTFWRDVERAAQLIDRLERVETDVQGRATSRRVALLEDRVAELETMLGIQPSPPEPRGTPGSSGAGTAGSADPDDLTAGNAAGNATGSEADGSTGMLSQVFDAAVDTPSAAGTGEQRGAGEQSGEEQLRRPVEWWVGVAAGYPLPATLHVGLQDLWPRLHLRGGMSFDASGSFGLEALALYSFPTAVDAPILPYLGLGPSLAGGANPGAGALALAGVDIPLGRQLDERGFLYLEAGPRVTFGNGIDSTFLGRAGLGYRF